MHVRAGESRQVTSVPVYGADDWSIEGGAPPDFRDDVLDVEARMSLCAPLTEQVTIHRLQ